MENHESRQCVLGGKKGFFIESRKNTSYIAYCFCQPKQIRCSNYIVESMLSILGIERIESRSMSTFGKESLDKESTINHPCFEHFGLGFIKKVAGSMTKTEDYGSLELNRRMGV